MTKLIEAKVGGGKKTRAHYRVGAIRNMTGGARVSAKYIEPIDISKVMPTEEDDDDEDKTTAIVSFITDKYVVMENVGTLTVAVELSIMGELSSLPVPMTVRYE